MAMFHAFLDKIANISAGAQAWSFCDDLKIFYSKNRSEFGRVTVYHTQQKLSREGDPCRATQKR
jgi:hypothetical protein